MQLVPRQPWRVAGEGVGFHARGDFPEQGGLPFPVDGYGRARSPDRNLDLRLLGQIGWELPREWDEHAVPVGGP